MIHVDESRRRELSDFLRTRRARISPEDAGLASSARRRTPGLRREEVALLANIGVTWYTRLEQGQPINVSGDVLERIASALQMDGVESEHLFLLAGQHHHYHPRLHEDEVAESLLRILQLLEPNPACVYGRRWDILAHNKAAAALFGYTEQTDPKLRNMLYRFFMLPTSKELFPRWHEVAPNLAAQFRAVAARYPGDPSFEALISELLAFSPEFRQFWARHDVRGVTAGYKHIFHPQVGELVLDYTKFALADHPDMRCIVYTAAAGSEQERKLRALVAPGIKELVAN